MPIRQPIVVVLGHVDHGKTTLLDKVRGTVVAVREPGAITQHIGASYVPTKILEKLCMGLLRKFNFKIEVPGLLFVDTPGHAAFSSLRRRGGSVADIAILVVDVNEGVMPQTVESLEILKARRTPFIVAANKVDLLPGWRQPSDLCFFERLKTLDRSVARILDEKVYEIVASLSQHGINADRYDRVADFRKTVAIVPVSARTGEGVPDLLAILVGLTQQYLKRRLEVSRRTAGTVLEVREDPGLGVNINVILYDGVLREGDTIVVGGKHGPVTTKVRAILVPKPLDEIRDPSEKFKSLKEVSAAAGVKIAAPNLEDVIAGSPLYTAASEEQLEEVKAKVGEEVESVRFSTDKAGVVVKADTLGSLEAILGELKASQIAVRMADVGDISKRDIVEASVAKRSDLSHGAVLGFNVKVLPDAQDEALRAGVKIFRENVIYRLMEEYFDWVRSLKEEEARIALEALIRPGKVKVLPGCLFRRSKPAICGVEVQAGRIRPGYPLTKEDGTFAGRIVQIQERGESLREAVRGMQVAISMKEPTLGRQVKEGETLYVDMPENHVRNLLRNYRDTLTPDEEECLKEFLEVKRKINPYFCLGV
ncbi:MAG: translation initiation factor aIF-2 [Candidatus Hecatellales archaeon B24]|nr:MAG: translation initiation factor aIF-2 [Candidatus Hecatellales archaeon B24]